MVLFQIAAPGEDTVRRRCLGRRQRSTSPSDEDTLSGLEAVPAVDTAVVVERRGASASTSRRERGRAEERRPSRRVRAARRSLLLVLLLAAVVALVIWGLYR